LIARPPSGPFYEAIPWKTFYEIGKKFQAKKIPKEEDFFSLKNKGYSCRRRRKDGASGAY
jgi:hypothetical protein